MTSPKTSAPNLEASTTPPVSRELASLSEAERREIMFTPRVPPPPAIAYQHPLSVGSLSDEARAAFFGTAEGAPITTTACPVCAANHIGPANGPWCAGLKPIQFRSNIG